MKDRTLFTKLLSLFCLVSLLCSLLIGCKPSDPAEEQPPVEQPPVEQPPIEQPPETVIPTTGSVTVDYQFAKTAADRPGDAQGTITLTPSKSGRTLGYYHLFFSRKGTILQDYEAIAVQKITGEDVEIELPYGMLLPPDATEILVFEDQSATRRSFQKETPAAAIVFPAQKCVTLGEIRYSFASVSDVHLNYADYGAADKWTAALDFFAELGLESVIVSGDMTGDGTDAEYQAYLDAIEASYYSVEDIYEGRGNHDSQRNDAFLEYTENGDEVRPFADAPYFYVLKEAKGEYKDNLFIFMAQELNATGTTHTQDNFSTAQLDWLEGLLEEYAGTQTNIFLIQHAVIHNFGPGDRYDGVYVQPMIFSSQYPNNLRFKGLLTKYKEIIMMSGHTHLSLYDWLNYSDEEGTAARMIHNSSISQPRCYTADGSISYNSEGKTTKTEGSEGYAAYVYDDYILYVGYNLTTGKIIPRASFLLDSYTEQRDVVTALELITPPTKTVYREGEAFDARGLSLMATWEDGTKEVVRGWELAPVGALSQDDRQITLTFGGKTLSVSITVKGAESDFAGEGSKESPYLIQTAEDFLKLTECFNGATDASSPYGAGKFFLQTADIDMTGVAGYAGTSAQGGKKYYFGGCYDGGGHTLTVNIQASSGQCSVFPYICGAIYNLSLRGSITAPDSAQPIRTVEKAGVIANCDIAMTLTSSIANGLCYSNHGTLYRLYVHSEAKKPLCTTDDGKVYHVVTEATDLDGFDNESDADRAGGLAALRAVIPGFLPEDLLPVTIKDGTLSFEK